MREAKEVEGLRFPFPSAFAIRFGIPPELDSARLVRVKIQSELPQSFSHTLAKTICIRFPLEPENDVIRIADHDHLASRMFSAPDIRPEIEHIMKIDIRKERRVYSPYIKANFEFERTIKGWRTGYVVLDLRLKR